jgi:Spy/CpxP family protein refolding chaperone
MKTKHLILLLITGLIITGATSVMAKTEKTMRHLANSGFSPLAQIDLSTEQTEKIRELRMAFEESIMPLKLQEHQVKAELDLFWLQMTPDTKKIKSAQKNMHDIKFQILEKETEYEIALREVMTKDQLSRFLALGCERVQGQDGFNHHPPRPHQPERY